MVDADQMPGIMGDDRQSMRGLVAMDKKEGCVGDETQTMRGVLTLKCIHGARLDLRVPH